MATQFVLGADCGGTNTRGVIGEWDGARLSGAREIVIAEPGNFQALGPEGFRARMAQLVDTAGMSRDQIQRVRVFVAGLDIPLHFRQAEGSLDGLFGRSPRDIVADNDLGMPLNGAMQRIRDAGGSERNVAALIAGTGNNIAFEKDCFGEDARRIQSSGTWFMLGDLERSGFWVGNRGLSEALEQFQRLASTRSELSEDHRVQRYGSRLLKAVYSKTNALWDTWCNNRDNPEWHLTQQDRESTPFLERVYTLIYRSTIEGGVKERSNKERVDFCAALSEPVAQTATAIANKTADPEALRIVREVGENLARSIAKGSEYARITDFHLALVGGLLKEGTPLWDSFTRALSENGLPLKINDAPGNPYSHEDDKGGLERALTNALLRNG